MKTLCPFKVFGKQVTLNGRVAFQCKTTRHARNLAFGLNLSFAIDEALEKAHEKIDAPRELKGGDDQ